MELVAIGGLAGVARTDLGSELGAPPARPAAPGPAPAPVPPPPGLHAPAEPSLPPPWALSGPGAVAELLTSERAVFAAAHAAYHAAGVREAEMPARELVL